MVTKPGCDSIIIHTVQWAMWCNLSYMHFKCVVVTVFMQRFNVLFPFTGLNNNNLWWTSDAQQKNVGNFRLSLLFHLIVSIRWIDFPIFITRSNSGCVRRVWLCSLVMTLSFYLKRPSKRAFKYCTRSNRNYRSTHRQRTTKFHLTRRQLQISWIVNHSCYHVFCCSNF